MGKATGTGRVLLLPSGAVPPFAVYVNGDEQREGVDYELGDGRIVFGRDLRWAKRTGVLGWLVMGTAGVGFYEESDVIDLHAGDGAVSSGLMVERS